MTELFRESFDGLWRWSLGGGFTIVAGGRNGNGGQSTGTTSANFTIIPTYQDATVTVGFAFQVSTIAANRMIFQVLSDNGGTIQDTLTVNTDGSLSVRRGTTTGTALGTSSTGLIAINTWHYVEMQILLSPTVGAVTVRLDGAVVIGPLTNQNTRFSGTATVFDTVRLGSATGGNNLYDDMYLKTGASETFNGDIGAVTTPSQERMFRESLRVLESNAPIPGSSAVRNYRTTLRVLESNIIMVGDGTASMTFGATAAGTLSGGTPPPATAPTAFEPFVVRRTTGGDVARAYTGWGGFLRYGPLPVSYDDVKGTTLTGQPWGYDAALVTVQVPASVPSRGEMVLVRGGFGYPTTPLDGTAVWYSPDNGLGTLVTQQINQQVLDQPVTGGRWYYYTLFIKVVNAAGPSLPGTWLAAAQINVLVPKNYGHADKLFHLFPPFYQDTDDQQSADGRNGPLRKFTAILGYDADYNRTLLDGVLNVYDPDLSPLMFIQQVGANLGFPPEDALGGPRYRTLVGQLWDLEDQRGTIPGLQSLILAASNYDTVVHSGINMLLAPDDAEFATGVGHWEAYTNPHVTDMTDTARSNAHPTASTFLYLVLRKYANTDLIPPANHGQGILEIIEIIVTAYPGLYGAAGYIAGPPAAIPQTLAQLQTAAPPVVIGTVANYYTVITNPYWTGDYVLLGDGTQAYWNGTAWVAGTGVTARPALATLYAGSPGYTQPNGAAAPANLAALQAGWPPGVLNGTPPGVPAVGWKAGDYIVLGDGTQAHMDYYYLGGHPFVGWYAGPGTLTLLATKGQLSVPLAGYFTTWQTADGNFAVAPPTLAALQASSPMIVGRGQPGDPYRPWHPTSGQESYEYVRCYDNTKVAWNGWKRGNSAPGSTVSTVNGGPQIYDVASLTSTNYTAWADAGARAASAMTSSLYVYPGLNTAFSAPAQSWTKIASPNVQAACARSVNWLGYSANHDRIILQNHQSYNIGFDWLGPQAPIVLRDTGTPWTLSAARSADVVGTVGSCNITHANPTNTNRSMPPGWSSFAFAPPSNSAPQNWVSTDGTNTAFQTTVASPPMRVYAYTGYCPTAIPTGSIMAIFVNGVNVAQTVVTQPTTQLTVTIEMAFAANDILSLRWYNPDPVNPFVMQDNIQGGPGTRRPYLRVNPRPAEVAGSYQVCPTAGNYNIHVEVLGGSYVYGYAIMVNHRPLTSCTVPGVSGSTDLTKNTMDVTNIALNVGDTVGIGVLANDYTQGYAERQDGAEGTAEPYLLITNVAANVPSGGISMTGFTNPSNDLATFAPAASADARIHSRIQAASAFPVGTVLAVYVNNAELCRVTADGTLSQLDLLADTTIPAGQTIDARIYNPSASPLVLNVSNTNFYWTPMLRITPRPAYNVNMVWVAPGTQRVHVVVGYNGTRIFLMKNGMPIAMGIPGSDGTQAYFLEVDVNVVASDQLWVAVPPWYYPSGGYMNVVTGQVPTLTVARWEQVA